MRILILSAATGGGHMRASSAIKSYILKNNEDAVVEIIDTLKYISPLLDKTISEGYEYIAKKAPKLFGAMYKSTNKENYLSSFLVSFNNLFSKKLLPLLDELKPDVIVSTHPFATEMVSNLKGIGSVNIPLICIMTDYAPHRAWINENVEAYVVSNDQMVETMKKNGVDESLIYPFGIPIDDTFHTTEDKDQILEELGLSKDVPTILIMAGSFGVTDILKIYQNITDIDMDFQIIVITGRNEKLYESFKRLLERRNEREVSQQSFGNRIMNLQQRISVFKDKQLKTKNTKLIMYTDEVHKYMHVSDLIITKPGGLTVSEALACNLPMAIFNAIPGQEEENADFLINNNMAVRIGKGSTCVNTIKELLENKEQLESMRNSCENFDKSESTKNILDLINKLITQK